MLCKNDEFTKDITCDRAFFFFWEKEEKKKPDTFTSQVVCRPLIKASVNIWVIMSDFTGNSGGLIICQTISLRSKAVFVGLAK